MHHTIDASQNKFRCLLAHAEFQSAKNVGLPNAVLKLASHHCLLHPSHTIDATFLSSSNDATSSIEQLSSWAKEYPGCDWSVLTGEKSGIVVVDTDLAHLEPIHALSRDEDQETLCAIIGNRLLGFYRCPSESLAAKPKKITLTQGLTIHLNASQIILPHDDSWPNLSLPIQSTPGWLQQCILESQTCAESDLAGVSHAGVFFKRAHEISKNQMRSYRNKKYKQYEENRKACMRLIVLLGLLKIAPQGTTKTWAQMRTILRVQSEAIDIAVRRKAWQEGKDLICRQGLRKAASQFLPERIFPKSSVLNRAKSIAREKCPYCRSHKYKSIWPTCDAAMAFSKQFYDDNLRAYACPCGYGWHLGHKRKNESLP